MAYANILHHNAAAHEGTSSSSSTSRSGGVGGSGNNSRRRWSPAARELVGGVLAGGVNVTAGYPFDTLKVRLQAAGGTCSMADCFWSIWRTDGARGFFRGLSSPLIGGAAETGVNYAVYSKLLRVLTDWHQQQQQLPASAAAGTAARGQASSTALLQPHLAFMHHQHMQQQQYHHHHYAQQPPLAAVPVAGAVAGVVLSFILSPTELVKCRMQVGQHTSPLACLRHVVASEGLVRGLSRGLGATLAREVPGNALFFTTYEGLRRQWPGARGGAHGGSSSSGGGGSSSSGGGGSSSGGGGGGGALAAAWDVVCDAGGAILCGGLAGVVMWGTVLPLDVAKTRIQTAAPGTPWDTGVVRQLRMMWREGGRRALWAGLAPTLLRAFPANAAQWLAWELAMRQLLPPAYEEQAQHAGGGSSSSSANKRRRQQQQRPAAGDGAVAAAAAAAAASTAA